MLIGGPKEIKNHEYRAGLAPGSVRECVHHGHSVIVETSLGAGIGCTDDDYRDSGATIVETPDQVFAEADLVINACESEGWHVVALIASNAQTSRSSEPHTTHSTEE